jgi:competence ComEA-like helix-hairpin-helix protein
MKRWKYRFLSTLLVAGLYNGTVAWSQPTPTPTPPAAPMAPKMAPVVKPTGKVNINTADEAMLTSLKGIGPTKAKEIIDYRQKNGPFKSVDDLVKVKGIGEKTVAQLRDLLSVE